MRETADSQYLRSPLKTRCVDLRHGGECRPGQAGAAASKATVARTDALIRKRMAEARRRFLVFLTWYGYSDATELGRHLQGRGLVHRQLLREEVRA